MVNLLEIDGSVLEGGGQILRTSISLSAILGVPVRVINIRAGRSKPGLAAQHLKGIQLVGQMCQAKISGDQLGSTTIEFIPGPLRGGHYTADTKTAGSISLLIQVALPCALFADDTVTLELKGGTNVDMAPQIDFMTEVFRYNLQKFGADFTTEVHRRGYFPKGGGHVTVTIKPVHHFRPITLLQPGLEHVVHEWSFVAGSVPPENMRQMSEAAKSELEDACDSYVVASHTEDKRTRDSAFGIILKCESGTECVLGADGLGRRGVGARGAGLDAGRRLREGLRLAVCVDERTQDQLIIYMALATGKSKVKAGPLTLHTKTAIYITEKIAKAKFTVVNSGLQNNIECDGVGFLNKNVPDNDPDQ